MIKLTVKECNSQDQEAIAFYYVKASTEEEFNKAMHAFESEMETDLVTVDYDEIPNDFWSAAGFHGYLISAVDDQGNDRMQWAKEWF